MRKELREATDAAHRRLDAAAGSLPLTCDHDYSIFLKAQYSARAAMERAFAHTPPADIQAPPAQTPHLARDIASLGRVLPVSAEAPRFDNPLEALGAAWVIAGSSLGNRTLLARRRKAGLSGADTFLSDPSMPDYFRSLLAVIEAADPSSSLEPATRGALTCFALFEGAFADHLMEQAA
ncbi:biliverdin-producing heme oxygenase [Qipengyuania aquimaris]|uniref:biliverdin-producing heme oxygenase n=1 Tax=Qipengyuania aquimaris TaxID=255984 RepID=UPI001C9760E8|nr:biliverdin-producing heme oxygenase [Qipengyuania aquimaris]MBY6127805.1 biliverdin-producing heme oxygenase [Qipengyuania aquimaris]